MAITEIISYDTNIYDFRRIIQEKLEYMDLENIHKLVNYNVFTLENDQSSEYHKLFYANCDIDSKFDSLYRQFVEEYVTSYTNDKRLIYQKRPTFRIHYNNNLAVGEFHRDSNYSHPKEEINFFLPVTKCWDTNTIWIESEDGKEDYKPVELEYGQIFVFNGGLLTHGNKVNTTGATRVSIDFRCLTSEHAGSLNALGSSGKTNKKFIIGDYYERL